MTLAFFMDKVLSWIISIISLYMMYKAGNKQLSAWIISGFCQLLWLIYIVYKQEWGLLPLNIGMWIIAFRNYRKWKHEEIRSAYSK